MHRVVPFFSHYKWPVEYRRLACIIIVSSTELLCVRHSQRPHTGGTLIGRALIAEAFFVGCWYIQYRHRAVMNKSQKKKNVLGCHWVKLVGEGGGVSSFLFILPHGALRGKKRLRACCADPAGRKERASHQAEPLLAKGEEQPRNAFPAWGQLHLLYLGSVSWRQCFCRSHQGIPGNFHPLPLLQMAANGFSLWWHLCLHLG